MSPTISPRLDPDVVWVDVDSEIVAVQRRVRTVHVVSQTGALLWPYLDGVTPIATLAADVAAAFGLPAETALTDVVRFVSDMAANELVVLDDGVDAGPEES